MSSQLQVSGEAKIRDIQGPVVANSGVITALDGAASQYVRGDGTLADFPTSSGGGSSVSYYLNSSVSQGTIGGVAYRELSKEPIIGAGTDIAISADGYVASYLTDANDPDVLSVPGGNFNCEFYFSVNSDAHNPSFYAELYKYDGSTFTLLGSSVGVPESINQGTTIAPYYFAIPVATAALALTDRLAIRIYVNVDTRTVTLHTENGHLCQVVTTFSKGMVSLNNLTDQSQFLTTGTAGTNFAIASSGDTHTFNLPTASATNTGKLSSTDWSVFNSKQAALTFTAPLVNTSNTISIPVATSLVDGYLDNADWVKFNTAYNDSIISAAVTGTTTKTLTLNQQDGGTVTASWTDDNTDAVSSVFGRTGAVVAVSGDYTTDLVTEGTTNLYFTNTRSRLALSFTAGSGAYNSSTGVITIPTNTSQLTNGANFITLASLSAGTGITYNNTTGVITNSAPDQTVSLSNGAGISVTGTYPSFTIASTITQYTDALARAAISLTTTGTSGNATYNSTTGVLNVPNYTPDLSGYVTIGTTQTITGTKTFDGASRQESGILLKNGVIAGLAGYTSLGGATNGLSVQLSGSSSIQTLIFQSAAAYSYTLPATSGTIALTSNISYPVTSVFGRTGAIVAVSGDYNTDLVTEGTTNLYFTNTRSRSAISLTTTGTSGPASYNSTTGVLNVPQYSTDLSGYVTIATTQTITGNKTFSEATRQDSGLLLKNGVLAGATGYASLGGASNGLVVQLSGSANQQTLIFQSGAAYSYTLPATSGTLALTSQLTSGTVTSVGLSSATSGVTIGSSPITTSGTITLAIATASGSQNGLLSSTDWTTFNNKQSALTNPVTGTGTTNYLPKFTGASTIGNSIMSESGTAISVAGNVQVNGDWSSTYPVYQLKDTRVGGAEWNIENGRTIGNLEFYNGAAGGTKLTLTPSGNLGLGVTPSAWGSNARALEYYAGSVNGCVVGFDDGSFQFGNNIYNNGGWLYKANGAASNYFQIDGRHVWRIAPSGTAGNAITFTQAMTLFSTGNLGIGVGGTDGGYKLDVNGTGRFSGVLNVFVGGNDTRLANFSTSTYGSARGLRINSYQSSNGGQDCAIEFDSGVAGYGGFKLSNSGTPMLTLVASGAATFSSSVTASGDILANGSSIFTKAASGGYQISLNAQATTQKIRFDDLTGGAYGVLAFEAGNGSGGFIERMRINSSGNVGIGTNSPSNPPGFVRFLNISGNDAALTISNTSGTAKNWTLGALESGTLAIFDGTTNTFSISSTGAASFSSTISAISVTSSSSLIQQWSYNSAPTAYRLQLNTIVTSGLVKYSFDLRNNSTDYPNNLVLTNGNVLIGTTTDSGYKLNVAGSLNIGQDQYLRGGGYKMAYRSSTINFQYSGTTGWQVNNDADNLALLSITNSGTATFTGLVVNYNTFNTQTASYTLVLADASKIVETNVGSANTVTVPTNASVAFPIGTEITVMQYGAGVTTIASAGGVTINSKSNARIIANRYTGATLVKRGTDEWYLIGNIVP